MTATYTDRTSYVLLSLLLLLCLMLAPYFFINTWSELVEQSADPPVIYQAAGFLVFYLASAFSWRGKIVLLGSSSEPSLYQKVFILFCIYTLSTAIISIDPLTSFLFSIIHLLVFLALIALWNESVDLEKKLPVIGWCLFIYIGIFAAILGPRGGRTLGFLPPNDIAKLAMVAGSFCLFSRGWLRLASVVLTYAVVLSTQSRGTLIALTLFYAFVFIGGRRSSAKVWAIFILIVIFALVVILDALLGGPLFERIADQVFLVDDLSRGLNSGLTGRVALWQQGWEVFVSNPLLGLGLRTRQSFLTDQLSLAFNAHSGIINMLLDVGLLGGVLLSFSLFGSILNHFKSSKDILNKGQYSAYAHRVAGAFLLSAIVLWVLEPIYINIGSPFSLAILLFMALNNRRSGGSRLEAAASITRPLFKAH